MKTPLKLKLYQTPDLRIARLLDTGSTVRPAMDPDAHEQDFVRCLETIIRELDLPAPVEARQMGLRRLSSSNH
jgi:hypothetical protein